MNIFKFDHPAPDYRLVVNGTDITPRIRGCLVELTITDNRHLEADTLDVTLTDHKGDMELPPHGAKISVAIGYRNQALINKGIYVVDEVEHSGAPDQINIRARSADLRAHLTDGMPAQKSRSWHKKTILEIVSAIANEHGLIPVVGKPLDAIRIHHIDQTHESDAHFLTRLGERYDALFAVKEGRLLFMPIAQGISISGKILNPVTIIRRDGDQHRYVRADRNAYTGVRAYWNNVSGAKRQMVIAGTTEKAKELKETYASEADALYAAKSELARLQRGKTTFSLNLARGHLGLEPEAPIQCHGFKPEIDNTKWVAIRVTHQLSESTGLTSSFEAESH